MKNCKGRIYKAKINNFFNAKGEYVSSIRMVPQKRLSCKGCKNRWFLEDSVGESTSYGDPPIIPNNVKNGKVYRLEIVNESRDFESGIVDDWDHEFIEVNKGGDKNGET